MISHEDIRLINETDDRRILDLENWLKGFIVEVRRYVSSSEKVLNYCTLNLDDELSAGVFLFDQASCEFGRLSDRYGNDALEKTGLFCKIEKTVRLLNNTHKDLCDKYIEINVGACV